MSEPARRQYRISLLNRSGRELSEVPFLIRHPIPGDRDGLAELMLDAYLGTIDYAGEGIEEARAEVEDYLANDPRLDSSWVVEDGDRFLAAILLSTMEDEPLVGYVMTRASAKGHGLAAGLLEKSLRSLQDQGWASVGAFITPGNTASERLFARAGASLVD